MYNEHEIIPKILRTIPEFIYDWKPHLDWWQNEDRPLGCDFARFGRFIKNQLSENNVNQDLVKKSFNLIEDFLKQGNERTQYYIISEIIENITNVVPEKYSEEDVRK